MKLAFLDINDDVEPFVLRWLPRLVDCQVVARSELQDRHPDILFYGDGKSGEHSRFTNCTRVFVTYENLYPDFSACDYATAYIRIDHPRYLRMPDWAIIYRPEQFLKGFDHADRVMKEGRQFCAFVASNGNPRRTKKRIDFFRKLSAYKKVNSGGRVLNNVGGRVDDHYAFARKHRFYMAFENARYPGYTTEKIADGMTNGCIPIYWGDPMINLDFNPSSFVNVSSFSDDEAAIRHIADIDNYPDLYRQYLEEPFFYGNNPPDFFDEHRILSFFEKILIDPRPRRKLFAVTPAVFKARRRLQPYIDSFKAPRTATIADVKSRRPSI